MKGKKKKGKKYIKKIYKGDEVVIDKPIDDGVYYSCIHYTHECWLPPNKQLTQLGYEEKEKK